MSVCSKLRTDSGKSAPQRGILQDIKSYVSRNRLGELLVTRGLITTKDLRFALGQQKQTNKPLGEIFLKHAMISRRQLAFILVRQTALRAIAACMFFFASAGIADKKAKADSLNGSITLASASVSEEFSRVAAYPGLFGTDEKRSGNLSPFTKWTAVIGRFEREMQNTNNKQLISDWYADMDSLRGQSLKKMAGRVNTLVNDVKYIGDNKNWGKSDYWATPVEFLKNGGDCEDYAIAKYTALRKLGVPEERMRVAIVHDTQKNIPHAVLVVYTNDGTVILDNQNPGLVDGDSPGRYRPIFSINRQAWWLHTAPGSSTVMASAQ